MSGAAWPVLAVVLIVCLGLLGKSADVLVEEAADLSLALGIPRVIVGATIVSLGTTLPEAVVSVLAAMRGEPDIALGNAVGSIICDTGLILGISCLIAPLPIDPRLVNRQGLIQLVAAVAMVGFCVPWTAIGDVFETGGRLPRWAGWIFLASLAVYIVWSIRSARRAADAEVMEDEPSDLLHGDRSTFARLAIMAISIMGVVVASEVLIAATRETAMRLQVPQGVIAATLVAFGTSLPELTICVTSTLKGRGDLAIGNIIGADILNVLFVSGAGAAVTAGGLYAGPEFFKAQFPAMLVILVTFRIALAVRRGDTLPRAAGAVLLALYLVYLGLSFTV